MSRINQTQKIIRHYYGKRGEYLQEHSEFFKTSHINKDLQFLIKALELSRQDIILDIACGQGRHSNALAKKGFTVDGVDFSKHLLDQAKKDGVKKHRSHYYVNNIEDFKLKDTYSKAYWFFSDLAGIDISKALQSISHAMRQDGRVLIDTDNIYRLKSYLKRNVTTELFFDAKMSELLDKKTNIRVRYLTLSEWKRILKQTGLFVKNTFGDYSAGKYTKESPRLILILKKKRQNHKI
ncbi:MAG: class I SAM-dependent methyltransferase [bacterium]|nr:class I SAM-dependent methyltransferase [bacterium]